MQTKEEKVRDTLHGLVKLFESGQAPAALARSTLPRPNTPASEWSLSNRLLLWIEGTGDARGFRQWEKVKRHVRKGATAIYILAPTLKCISDKSEPASVLSAQRNLLQPAPAEKNTIGNTRQVSDSSKRPVLCGFRAVPVFRFEDTEGAPLQENLEPNDPPPLSDVAKAWGLEVRYMGCSGPYLGYYRHSADHAPEIALATHDQQVFFHELAHAAQYRVWSDLKPAQKLRKEVAAELAACVLMRLYGTRATNDGASYQYIKAFCDQHGKPLSKTLWGLVADTEQILTAILSAQNQIQPA